MTERDAGENASRLPLLASRPYIAGFFAVGGSRPFNRR